MDKVKKEALFQLLIDLNVDVNVLLLPKNYRNERGECDQVVMAFAKASDTDLGDLLKKNTKSSKHLQKLKTMLIGILYDDFIFSRKTISESFMVDPSSITYHVKKNRTYKTNSKYFKDYLYYQDVYRELLTKTAEILENHKFNREILIIYF